MRLPVKGVLNRRFKRVFAYFCRGAKVSRRPGAGARDFREKEKRSRPAGPQMKSRSPPEAAKITAAPPGG